MKIKLHTLRVQSTLVIDIVWEEKKKSIYIQRHTLHSRSVLLLLLLFQLNSVELSTLTHVRSVNADFERNDCILIACWKYFLSILYLKVVVFFAFASSERDQKWMINKRTERIWEIFFLVLWLNELYWFLIDSCMLLIEESWSLHIGTLRTISKQMCSVHKCKTGQCTYPLTNQFERRNTLECMIFIPLFRAINCSHTTCMKIQYILWS